MRYLILILGFLLFVLESSVVTLPVVLLFLLFYTIITRSDYVFVIAFIVGIFLDMVMLRPLGFTSLYFLTILFLVFLYERKFEIGTIYFVMCAAFLSSFFYLLLFSRSFIFSQALVCAILSYVFYSWYKAISTPKPRAY